MPDHADNENHAEAVDRLLARRRRRLERLLQRTIAARPTSGIDEDRRRYLLEEAEDLYWNELSWEQLTGEEGLAERGLVEFTFPGFLALVEGLLLRETTQDAATPASPRPEVVEDVLRFLAGRHLELTDASDGEGVVEREVSMRLIDLVLYRLHDIDVEEVERLERAPAPED